jgi:hypothetical protein
MLGLAISLALVSGLSNSDGSAAQLNIRAENDHVDVAYVLASPTSTFQFDEPLPIEADVSPLDDAVVVSPEGVNSDQAFETFTLRLGPDRVRMDARYPVLTRLGEGWMIYLPALIGTSEPRFGDIVIEGPEGWSLVSGPGSDPLNGFVYIGPDRASGAETHMIADPELPDWLVADAREALRLSTAFYARALETPPPGQPALFVGLLPPGDRLSYAGDVTHNGVINLQFNQQFVSISRDERFTDLITGFVSHEVFHIWQGDRYRDQPGVNGRWLNEGAAEYFSLLAQAEGSGDDEIMRQTLARHLNQCVDIMSDHEGGLLQLAGPAAQSTRYSCGAVIQWMADAALQDTGGVVAVWRRLLNAEGGYDVDDFRSSVTDVGGMNALLDGAQGIEPAMLRSLQQSGVAVALGDPGADAWSNAALWPLLESTCDGQMGVLVDEGRYHLDTGDRCGPLSGDPEAIAIEGHVLADQSEAAFDAVETACANSAAVRLALKEGDGLRDVSVTCDAATDRPELRYQVSSVL